MEKIYYTCAEVADMLRVKEDTVWNWIRTKKLKAVKIGGKIYRIHKDEIKKLMEEA